MNANEQKISEIREHLESGGHYAYEGAQGVMLAVAFLHPALGEWRYLVASPVGGPPVPEALSRLAAQLLYFMEGLGPLSEWTAEGP